MHPIQFAKALCLLGLLAFTSAYGKEFTPKERAELFLQTLTRGETNKAFEVLFEGSPFAQSNSDQLARLKEDVRKHLSSGRVVGFERVKEQTHGQSVVRLVYLLKLETQPLVWEFHFYKAKRAWMLARLGFDEDLRRLD